MLIFADCKCSPRTSESDFIPIRTGPGLTFAIYFLYFERRLNTIRGILADGYQQLALKWVFDINGGLASEADYPYIGVTNYCNTTKPVVKFKKVCSPHCISLLQRLLQFYVFLLMQDSNTF